MWDNALLKALFQNIGFGSSAGLVIVLAYLLIRLWDRWVANKRQNKTAQASILTAEAKVEVGTAEQWRKFAQYVQKQLDGLRKELDRVYKGQEEERRHRHRCERQVNALRIRSDRYEEAMRQASIPFEPFDSDAFDDDEESPEEVKK